MADDTLYILDLDRTLLDVDMAMSIAEEACHNLGVDFSKIKEDQQRSFARAVPYSPLATLEDMGDGVLERFKQEFLKLAGPARLVFPDAKRYLDKLEHAGKQYMILTYARDARWQELKMQGAGLDNIPHIIIFHPKKSHDIDSWRSKDGLFNVPLDTISPASEVVFVDDRLRVFDGIPKNCKGYYLKRSDWQDDLSDIGKDITQIASFDELIDKL
ncbi:MAG TPA: hypothetical protein VFW77_01765 [Candidatus Saccharimonadales bacterium]|nr:hypothetical protein [Candidatus Saccharimonadales bacterium]